jgi:6-phosphogluconolactonase
MMAPCAPAFIRASAHRASGVFMGVSLTTTTTTTRAAAARAATTMTTRVATTRRLRTMVVRRAGGDADGAVVAPGTRTVVDDASKTMGALVRARSAEAIASRGVFSIALAGGSLVKALASVKDYADVDFTKWRVFWVDERCVPHDDDESNYGGAMKALFNDVNVPKSQLYAIDETLCETNAGAAAGCAKAYEDALKALTPDVIGVNDQGLPVFDLLLLGFGPDGHICSLFPNHELLNVTEGWILPITDSPKPPPERITFSLPVVNAAREKVFVASGEGKAEMTAIILEHAPLDGSIPAALVTGDVTWIIDQAGASRLKK